ARDSATLQIGGMLNSAGNLASSVVLAHVLGANEQGQFYIAQALFAFFFFTLNLGVVQAAISQIAGASARSLDEKIANWLAYVAKAYLAASIVLIGLGWVLLPWFAEWQLDSRQIGWWAWLLCLTPLVEMPKVVCCTAFQGTRRMLPLAQCENGVEACRAVLVVVGAAITADPLGPIVGTLAASLIGSVLSIDMYRRMRAKDPTSLPALRDIYGRIREVPLREGMRLGVRIGVMRNIDALCLEVLPPIIIKKFGGIDAEAIAAYFRIARNIMKLPMMMLQGITRTALPTLSEYTGRGDWIGLRRTWLRITLLGGGVTAACVLVMALAAPWIVQTFYPRDYWAPITSMVWILALAHAMQSFHVGIDAFYLATNKLRVGIVIGIVGIISYLSSLIVLVSWLGATGPAWAIVVAAILASANLVYVLHFFSKAARAQREGVAA
ncbi:MAG: hypothetical protein EPO68_13560, partial [Planctomycetota bacterium]